MTSSVFLSFAVPRLRQCFVFWQNIADKTLFGFQAYSHTSSVNWHSWYILFVHPVDIETKHCGFQFKEFSIFPRSRSLEGGTLQYEHLESGDGTRYMPLSEHFVLADRIADDDNGNFQQTKHGTASVPASSAAPFSKTRDSSGQGSQSKKWQGASEVPKDSSSSGNSDGSGGDSGENNPNGKFYDQNQLEERKEEYLHIFFLDKSYGKKQIVVDITNSKTTCEVFLN